MNAPSCCGTTLDNNGQTSDQGPTNNREADNTVALYDSRILLGMIPLQNKETRIIRPTLIWKDMIRILCPHTHGIIVFVICGLLGISRNFMRFMIRCIITARRKVFSFRLTISVEGSITE